MPLIDYDLCMGDKNCNKVCPEVFEYDEDQLVLRILLDEIPVKYQDLVRRAAGEKNKGFRIEGKGKIEGDGEIFDELKKKFPEQLGELKFATVMKIVNVESLL
ncbi:MAG: ferredoxin [Desulfatiglandaceae bacterium]